MSTISISDCKFCPCCRFSMIPNDWKYCKSCGEKMPVIAEEAYQHVREVEVHKQLVTLCIKHRNVIGQLDALGPLSAESRSFKAEYDAITSPIPDDAGGVT